MGLLFHWAGVGVAATVHKEKDCGKIGSHMEQITPRDEKSSENNPAPLDQGNFEVFVF